MFHFDPCNRLAPTHQRYRQDRTGQGSDSIRRTDFGRPFVKRFALCYQTVVCLSVCPVCLSVMLVYCGQMVGWIKMKLGMPVGLGPGHIVLDWDPATHICCGQMDGWIKMPLGREVGLSPSDIALDGDPAPLSERRGELGPHLTIPQFSAVFIVARLLDGSRCHLAWR